MSPDTTTTQFDSLGIDPEILKVIERIPYKSPTEIQELAIPSISNGRNALVLARTGTGKTASYVIPIMNNLLNERQQENVDWPTALVLVPTEELAHQVTNDFMKYAKPFRIAVLSSAARSNQRYFEKAISWKPKVLIGTPEGISDMHAENNVDLSTVNTLVIDEADFLLGSELMSGTYDVLSKLENPDMRQTVLVTATISSALEGRVTELLPGGKILNANYLRPVTEIKHQSYEVEFEEKLSLLHSLLSQGEEGTTIVFANNDRSVEHISRKLKRSKINVSHIKEEEPVTTRLGTLDKFRSGKFTALIATRRLARGIDVSHVKRVINYDMPSSLDEYRHTAGRTGRASREGTSIIFQEKAEQWKLDLMSELLEIKVERAKPPKNLKKSKKIKQSEISLQETIRICREKFGYSFTRPGLLLTALNKNNFNEDPREKVQLLTIMGHVGLKLALVDILTSLDSEAAPMISDITRVQKQLASLGSVERVAIALGMKDLCAEDRIKKGPNINPETSVNAIYSIYNILGAIVVDDASLKSLPQVVRKIFAHINFDDYRELSVGFSKIIDPFDDQFKEETEKMLGHTFKDRKWIDIAFAPFRKFEQGRVNLDRRLLSRGVLVFDLGISDILRRARFKNSLKEVKEELFTLNQLSEAWLSTQGGKVAMFLQKQFGWSRDIDENMARNVMRMVAGAIYSDSGYRAALTYIEKCFENAQEWMESAAKGIRYSADLDKLQIALDEEGERVKKRNKAREEALNQPKTPKKKKTILRSNDSNQSELKLFVQTEGLGKLQFKTGKSENSNTVSVRLNGKVIAEVSGKTPSSALIDRASEKALDFLRESII